MYWVFLCQNFLTVQSDDEVPNMPMHWRRVVDISAFLIAIGVAVWVRYLLGSAWWVAIAVGLLVFVVTPFIMVKRMERGH